MLIDFQLSQTGIIVRVKLRNSSVATGAGLTGLTNASSGLVIAAAADNEATTTAYTVAGSLVDTITTLGTYAAPTATHCRFKEFDATNHKGVYELQFENSRFAVASSKSLLISISGAANLAECDVCIPLRGVNPYDSVRGGMTALPNAAAGASGGNLINGSNAGTVTLAALTVAGATTFTGNVALAAGLTVTQTTAGAAGISVTGNGAGAGMSLIGGGSGDALALTGGASGGMGIDINTTAGDGIGITAGAGHGINTKGAGASKHGINAQGGNSGTSDGIHAAAGTGGVDIRGNLTGNLTGNVSGSVGSLTTNNDKSGYHLATEARTGTAQAGGASTITLDSGASASNDFYKGAWVVLTGGTGAGQTRLITGYVGSTKVATVSQAWATNPDGTTVFVIVPAADVLNVNGASGGDTPGTTTLLARLTSTRAGNLDNLDAAVSTRSTYAGGDTSGTTTLLTRIPGTVQPQTGDSYARLGAPAGLSIAADLAEIEAETDLLPTFPANFAALSISAGGHISNVDTLTTYTGNTPQTGDAYARLGAPAGASVSADVAAVKADTGKLATMMIIVGAGPNYQFTVQALANAPTGGGGSVTVAGYATGQDPATYILATAGNKLATDSGGRTILQPTGLDAIAVTDPGAPANHTTLSKMIVALWRSFYRKKTMTATQARTYADDGATPNATAPVSDDGVVQTIGPFA